MSDKRKQEWVQNASTEALTTIVSSLSDQERAKEGDPAYPLAGLAHIEGVGQVKLAAIRAELERRAL